MPLGVVAPREVDNTPAPHRRRGRGERWVIRATVLAPWGVALFPFLYAIPSID